MDWLGNVSIALCSGIVTNGKVSRVLTVGHLFKTTIGKNGTVFFGFVSSLLCLFITWLHNLGVSVLRSSVFNWMARWSLFVWICTHNDMFFVVFVLAA